MARLGIIKHFATGFCLENVEIMGWWAWAEPVTTFPIISLPPLGGEGGRGRGKGEAAASEMVPQEGGVGLFYRR